jgi:hypothetical protein
LTVPLCMQPLVGQRQRNYKRQRTVRSPQWQQDRNVNDRVTIEPIKVQWVHRVLGIDLTGRSSPSDDIPLSGVSLAGVSRASLAWRKLCDGVRSDLDSLKTEVITALTQSGRYDDDEIEDARAELTRLDEIFGVVSPQVIERMDDAIGAMPDARVPLLRGILGDIAAAEARINGNKTIKDVESNGLRNLALAKPALDALAGLRKEIEPLVGA